jgi:hypothetical protein
VKELTRESAIQHGSLVRLDRPPEVSARSISARGAEANSGSGRRGSLHHHRRIALGKAVLGKRLGATFEVKIGRDLQAFRIADVE